MRVYVFTGPTLPAEAVRAELDAICLPPVSQGDVYRASLEQPVAIGIIDGYFERVPSVWHKEVLWAMAQGIHVFGSASMGALRAAELDSFGMEGVGEVYAAFARGELEDDDEVAVIHGPEDTGYRALSEALVNIRATLRAAVEAGVLREAARDALEALAKALPYADRAWPLLLARAAREGVPRAELDALQSFLPTGRVDRKRLDALAMLRRMRERLDAGLEPLRVRYRFQHTDAWEQLRRTAGRLATPGPDAPPDAPPPDDALSPSDDALLEELRVSGGYADARRGALARALALELARQHNPAFDARALAAVAGTLRRELGLSSNEAFERWLADSDLTQLERFLADEARVRWVETQFTPDALRQLAHHLRARGDYPRLAARARDKARLLASRGLASPGLGEAGLSEEALFRWYFEERLRRPVPADLPAHARDLGLPDTEALRRLVLREYHYSRNATGG